MFNSSESLVVEQPQRCVCEDYLVLICCFDTLCVHDASAGCGKVSHTTLPCAVDIIWEREESIARASHAIQLGHPFLFLLLRKRANSTLEQTLPMGLLSAFQDLPGNVKIDGVSFFSALDAALEWEIKDPWVVTEPPEIGFSTRETGAVNA